MRKVIAAVFLLMIVSSYSLAADTYLYKDSCPSPSGGNMVVDKWSFYKCECTSYVAHKLNESGIAFNNSYGGAHWGYASNWRTAAQSIDITTTSTPRPGDVAWFSGHVAYVESVSGSDITISEYNITPHEYGYRTINVSSVETFIRFQSTLRIVGETGWYPPTKTCINADEWARVRYGRVIQSVGSNSICYEEYIRNPTFQSVLLGIGSLPQECTQ